MLRLAGLVVATALATLAVDDGPATASCRITSIDALAGADPSGELSLTGPDGARTVRLADVEKLPLVRIEACPNFHPPGKRFEGVLLADFLASIGAGATPSIEVSALDGYSVVIPREDWSTWPVILATRTDGHPLSRRERGPARIVYPEDRDPRLSTREYESRAVWLISRIHHGRRAD